MSQFGFQNFGFHQFGPEFEIIFASISHSNDYTLAVEFVADIDDTGSSRLAFEDPSSWSVVPTASGVPFIVESVEIVDVRNINLTVGIATNVEVYELNILSTNAKLASGASANGGAPKSFTASVSLPTVALLEIMSTTSVRVTFSREMRNVPGLIDVSNYVFTGGITALSVNRISPTIVEISTSEQTEDALYGLTVNP